MPKLIGFITHSNTRTMKSFLTGADLQNIKYIDVGAKKPAVVRLEKNALGVLGRPQCCFMAKCPERSGENWNKKFRADGSLICGYLDMFWSACAKSP